MFGYVYITTNNINNKKYIGKHKSKVFDDSYLGSGILLRKAIEKYGKENFSIKILSVCNNLEELNMKEKEFIKKYDAVNSKAFYNIASGGDGGYLFYGYSKEKRKEIHIRGGMNRRGERNGMFLRRGEKSPLYKRKRSEETKEKCRLSNLGKKRSEETRKRNSLANLREKNPNFINKKVYVYKPDGSLYKEYSCPKDCAKDLGFCKTADLTFLINREKPLNFTRKSKRDWLQNYFITYKELI